MLTPDYLREYDPLPRPAFELAAWGIMVAIQRVSRTKLVLENFTPPPRPVLFATNSTQRNDFLALRLAMAKRGVKVTSVTKARTYHEASGRVAERLGTIPIASRGYVLLVDFVAVNGRRPSDAEYRQLRDHIDSWAVLPRTEAFERMLRRPRAVLGHWVDPTSEPYADAVHRVYRALMQETLRLMRLAVAEGHSIQLYPEGTVSKRLGTGRIGAVQAAHALGLDIVPVGMNGCPEAIRGDGVLLRGGTIRLRFGEPLKHPVATLPKDFQAFDPASERAHRPALLAATETLMSRIDGLLDAPYRRPLVAPPKEPTSTHRFL
jgi:hypothetical protein